MPIVSIELTEDPRSPRPDRDRLAGLCDDLGTLFGSGPAGTWVKLRSLAADCYLENDTAAQDTPHPVFVEVLQARTADPSALAQEARAISQIVARACDRPAENVHVIYLPEAAGRIAFGGRLQE